ncbi:MAG: hypothetical protein KBD66_01145 [Candidatus Doudnabacteria bacterium]|nr:hypothetical protein [Candidatus Doudnabacteria bacterium]
MFLASALFLLVFALFNAQKTNAVAIKHVVDNQNVATQSNTQAFRGEMSNPVTGANLTAATLSDAEKMAGAAKKVFAATEVKVEKKNAQFVEIGFLRRAITSQQFDMTTGGAYSVILANKVATFTNATECSFSGKGEANAAHLAAGVAPVTAHSARMANQLTTTANAAMVT